MTAGADIRVVLVEDDQDLRESVTEWLELAGMRVGAVSSAAELYQLLPTSRYQVAVVDIGLPDQSGYVLAEYLRANTDMAIIMLTARGALHDKIKGYDCGADLYLVKPVDCGELSAAIASLTRRVRRRADEQPALPQIWRVSPAEWTLTLPGDTSISLSIKELKFLELLAATPGQPVARSILLTELYQRHDDHSGRSLDSLVRRLRAKIAMHTGLAVPIRTVHAIGYSFVSSIVIC